MHLTKASCPYYLIRLLLFILPGMTFADQQAIDQYFPSKASPQTHWYLTFETLPRYGLVVKDGYFQKSPADAPLVIFKDIRVAEISVPYSSSQPIVLDMRDNPAYQLETLQAGECPGKIYHTSAGDVCVEVRSRGYAWKVHSESYRIGEELVVWGVYQAGNYDYIMEYRFTDEGVIQTNTGSTGPKIAGAEDTQGHIHNFTWRYDIDLNGPDGDTVHKTAYINDPTTPKASFFGDDLNPKPIVTEGGFNWNSLRFRKLRVYDSKLTNVRRPTAYELQCGRLGIDRNVSPDLDFINKDYWVTASHPGETEGWNLTSYVNGEPTQGANVVVWYTVSAPHEHNMRDEDRDTVPVKWTSCQWTPQNLFDTTPIFQ